MTYSVSEDEAYASPAPFVPISPNDAKDIKPALSGRIINVTTTLPSVIFHNEESNAWDVRHTRGNSALYSSYYYLDQQTSWDTLLVGWTGELLQNESGNATNSDNDGLYLSDDEKSQLESKIRSANKSEKIYPVWLLQKDQQRWRKYAENIIWPALHYIQSEPSDGKQEAQWWHDYVRFNEAYATKIISLYKKGDIIWIHDYCLLLLPQILRMKIPNANIGLFMHAPFPSSEYFRCLSKRKELLEGMLGANLVAFQSYSFARHFISSCARLLGCEVSPNHVSAFGVHVAIDSLPIGIDTTKVENDCFNNPEIDIKVNAIRQLYGEDKKIIVGRDRLDTVRGVVQKLQAFEMFLSNYPEWRNKVVLIQVSSPAYLHAAKVEKKVSELVAHINGTFGELHFAPVQHYPMRIAKEEYLALLRVADLGLITSVRDGMNTTSLEFVCCQKENYSPLILSEFTGTAGTLIDSIQVNPWDSIAVANAINECLKMSEEKKKSIELKLYKHVTENTVQRWSSTFLERLIKNLKSNLDTHVTPALNRPKLFEDYSNATKKRLFLFDYDGTLTPIVKEPSAAIPSILLTNTLEKLSQDPKNEIWIISGRDQEFLEKWVGSKNKKLGLSAEHGCFIKEINSPNWINLIENSDMSWQKDVLEVFNYYTERTQGSFVEVKKAALTWHYRRSDPDFGSYQARECKNHLELSVGKKYDIEVMSGKANLEVRPKFVNKGEIVKRLVQNIIKESGKNPDFILCLGDDQTDEDMFRALNDLELNSKETCNFYPVTVGPAAKKTIAKSHLLDPHQVLETLGLLNGDINLFESAGTVDIDDRGHLKRAITNANEDGQVLKPNKTNGNSENGKAKFLNLL